MEENQNKDALNGVIGQRVKFPERKGLKIYSVFLSIIGVAVFVLGIVNLVASNGEYAPLFLVCGIIFVIAGVLSIFAMKKQEKVAKENEGRPTVKNNEDGTLTFYLQKGVDKTVNIKDIASVKFAPRVTMQFMVVVTQYQAQKDGTLIVKLNDGSKFKVHSVDDGMIVQNKILLLMNQAKNK